MKKTYLIMAVAFLAIGTCFSAMAAEHQIKMLNKSGKDTMVFEPAFLKVAPGDTVKFIPTNPSHDSASEFIPKGATAWKGANSKEVTVTLTKEGVYIYRCTPHTIMAMVGVIQVGKPTNLAEAKEVAKKMSAKFAINKDRLDNYLAKVK